MKAISLKRKVKSFLIEIDQTKSCNQVFSSDISKNGTFTSPKYPDPYPKNTNCVYQFNGSGKERVQIIFTDFDLYISSEDVSSKE
ncbi:suppressor of lurcher protein 1-like protein [Dinothrombium tinctorium]|uniref:Suppressor of lurcher protein 1-like protein n=1 Tax=Dinothrombium tinctorium TaxID=1965070 RepID=A0A3S3PV61_9ACAR|nr:suppressor of lurcher protein 1-like protein [Dinothrombium tinctorium]RWS10150.1 suppressor of lurcher protein 1-like protein [Dinothrombium tinctorium]RWS16957.1 suppressor of lurcher protein 1-like protein [Dinothrombium tinctorium]